MRWGRTQDASAQAVSVAQAGMPGGSGGHGPQLPTPLPKRTAWEVPSKVLQPYRCGQAPQRVHSPIHSSTLLGQRL